MKRSPSKQENADLPTTLAKLIDEQAKAFPDANIKSSFTQLVNALTALKKIDALPTLEINQEEKIDVIEKIEAAEPIAAEFLAELITLQKKTRQKEIEETTKLQKEYEEKLQVFKREYKEEIAKLEKEHSTLKKEDVFSLFLDAYNNALTQLPLKKKAKEKNIHQLETLNKEIITKNTLILEKAKEKTTTLLKEEIATLNKMVLGLKEQRQILEKKRDELNTEIEQLNQPFPNIERHTPNSILKKPTLPEEIDYANLSEYNTLFRELLQYITEENIKIIAPLFQKIEYLFSIITSQSLEKIEDKKYIKKQFDETVNHIQKLLYIDYKTFPESLKEALGQNVNLDEMLLKKISDQLCQLIINKLYQIKNTRIIKTVSATSSFDKRLSKSNELGLQTIETWNAQTQRNKQHAESEFNALKIQYQYLLMCIERNYPEAKKTEEIQDQILQIIKSITQSTELDVLNKIKTIIKNIQKDLIPQSLSAKTVPLLQKIKAGTLSELTTLISDIKKLNLDKEEADTQIKELLIKIDVVTECAKKNLEPIAPLEKLQKDIELAFEGTISRKKLYYFEKCFKEIRPQPIFAEFLAKSNSSTSKPKNIKNIFSDLDFNVETLPPEIKEIINTWVSQSATIISLAEDRKTNLEIGGHDVDSRWEKFHHDLNESYLLLNTLSLHENDNLPNCFQTLIKDEDIKKYDNTIIANHLIQTIWRLLAKIIIETINTSLKDELKISYKEKLDLTYKLLCDDMSVIYPNAQYLISLKKLLQSVGHEDFSALKKELEKEIDNAKNSLHIISTDALEKFKQELSRINQKVCPELDRKKSKHDAQSALNKFFEDFLSLDLVKKRKSSQGSQRSSNEERNSKDKKSKQEEIQNIESNLSFLIEALEHNPDFQYVEFKNIFFAFAKYIFITTGQRTALETKFSSNFNPGIFVFPIFKSDLSKNEEKPNLEALNQSWSDLIEKLQNSLFTYTGKLHAEIQKALGKETVEKAYEISGEHVNNLFLHGYLKLLTSICSANALLDITKKQKKDSKDEINSFNPNMFKNDIDYETGKVSQLLNQTSAYLMVEKIKPLQLKQLLKPPVYNLQKQNPYTFHAFNPQQEQKANKKENFEFTQKK